MRICKYMKDGGPLSKAWGFFLVEIKSLFSIVLLKFEDGSREAFHTHAFNAVSWVIKGKLVELIKADNNQIGEINVCQVNTYRPSLMPIITKRKCFHMVKSEGTTWAITFRGPWLDNWKEYFPTTKQTITLTHGRKVV